MSEREYGPKPRSAPNVKHSPKTAGEIGLIVADIVDKAPEDLCGWLVLAVVAHKQDGVARHSPTIVPSSVDDMPKLATLAEQAAEVLRAALEMDIPDSPPIV